jgi:signal transduction histidine kinase
MRMAEKKPAISAGLTQQILEELSSGVLAVAPDGTVLAGNQAASRHLGTPLEPGAKLESLRLAEPFLGVVRELLAAPATVQRREVVIETAAGEHREIGLSASPFRGDGKILGVLFLFTDMTERRVLERAADLNRQLADVGELAAGVVHELRTPLMVISGMAELTARRLADRPEEKEKQEIILRECRQLARIIEQFLSFARPFELEPGMCHPEAIAERAGELGEAKALHHGVKLTVEVEEGLPIIEADAARAGQAIANLIGNAVEAVEDGSGKVWLKGFAERNAIVFTVADDGPGIEVQPGQDIFKPFVTMKEGGTGLGLSIVSRIISAHGGTIGWENRPEGGAMFTVRLPIRRGERVGL